MAGRKSAGKLTPRHLKMTGKGWREDSASGFVRYAYDYVDDVRQGPTAREFADITAGFGTDHPQDKRAVVHDDDPTPIRDGRPENKENLSVQDMSISDQEIKLSIQEGRAPRMGF